VPAAVEEVGEASGGLERPPHLPRLLLRLLLPLLSAAHETPPSVACASLAMLPCPPPLRRRAGTSSGKFSLRAYLPWPDLPVTNTGFWDPPPFRLLY
jgi:hypothetical protein